MTDRLSVLNDTLALLGQERAQEINLATMGVIAKKVYGRQDEAKAFVLVRHGWVDALEYATLEVTPGLANWKYGAGYLLPEDALRAWHVDLDPCVRWEEGTYTTGGVTRKMIRCEAGLSLNVSYVRNAAYEALGPHLARAVSHENAAMTCWDVTGDQGRADRLADSARVKRLEAMGVDSMREGGQDVDIPDMAFATRASAF